MQRSTSPFLDFVPKFSLCSRARADLQKGIRNSFSVRTSPPAAKLGAGVEKSPGPSLFYALFTSPLAGAISRRGKRVLVRLVRQVGGEAAGWGVGQSLFLPQRPLLPIHGEVARRAGGAGTNNPISAPTPIHAAPLSMAG